MCCVCTGRMNAPYRSAGLWEEDGELPRHKQHTKVLYTDGNGSQIDFYYYIRHRWRPVAATELTPQYRYLSFDVQLLQISRLSEIQY
jgi:hypothetical protein